MRPDCPVFFYHQRLRPEKILLDPIAEFMRHDRTVDTVVDMLWNRSLPM